MIRIFSAVVQVPEEQVKKGVMERLVYKATGVANCYILTDISLEKNHDSSYR